MLKIRLQGTTNDIKWFLKILKRDKRFYMNTPSNPQEIKGTKKYKRVYTEVYRDGEEQDKENRKPEKNVLKCGSGITFGRARD